MCNIYICDLICKKGPLLSQHSDLICEKTTVKTKQKTVLHTCRIVMHMYQLYVYKLRCLRCFNSSLFKSQVTNVLTEVVPFCKSGLIYITLTTSLN